MAEQLIRFFINGEWKLPSTDGYSPSFVEGFLTTQVTKGMPRIRKNYRNQPIQVSVQYDLMTNREVVQFCQFYYGAIRSGQKKFLAKLDIGRGLLEYVCQIVGVPAFGEWTGYHGKVGMTLECVPPIKYAIQNMFPNDEYLIEFMALLPSALDPMGYVL